MRVRTLDQVNERSRDGRVFSAGQGSVRTIDDADTDMVDLMRSMAVRRLVEILDDEPAAADEPPVETKEAILQPLAADTTAVSELDSLRAQAEAAGVKVEKRWGVDRLRKEIAAAAEATE